MRIAIIGAGAVGCYLAARLTASGAEVELIARGAALDAIARDGVTVEGQNAVAARVAVSSIDQARAADLIVSCVKAYAIPALAPRLVDLLTPAGVWLTAVNGLPWSYGEAPLQRVDPGGRIRAEFPLRRAATCVAYLRSEVVRPGVVNFTGGKGLILGAADGDGTAMPLLAEAARAFSAAGIAASVTGDIATAIWNKLFGNIGLNPLSAITGLAADRILADRELHALLLEVTAEAMSVAAAEGATLESTAEGRVDFMRQLGGFRTSMLQDVDAGRAIELDAILGAMIEVADRRSLTVPASRRLYALVRAFAETRGLLPAS